MLVHLGRSNNDSLSPALWQSLYTSQCGIHLYILQLKMFIKARRICKDQHFSLAAFELEGSTQEMATHKKKVKRFG
jgi:hypothetical protein